MTVVAICESPIFIIGSPRSGTSILGWSLAQHSELAIGHESDMLFELTHPQKLEDVYRKVTGRPNSLDWLRQNGVDEDEFLASIGLGLNALLTSRSGDRRWIDQTPANTIVASTLVRLFPGARFLHILRDGRSVVNSMVNFIGAVPEEAREQFIAGGGLPEFATDFRCACETWVMYVTEALRFAENHPAVCMTVRNEQLRDDPVAGFDRVFSFLEVRPEPAPAEFFRTEKLNSSFPEHLPPGGADAPGSMWDAGDQALFETIAGPLQTHLEGAMAHRRAESKVRL